MHSAIDWLSWYFFNEIENNLICCAPVFGFSSFQNNDLRFSIAMVSDTLDRLVYARSVHLSVSIDLNRSEGRKQKLSLTIFPKKHTFDKCHLVYSLRTPICKYLRRKWAKKIVFTDVCKRTHTHKYFSYHHSSFRRKVSSACHYQNQNV